MKQAFFAIVCLFCLSIVQPALAAPKGTAAADPVPNAPAKVDARVTAVGVQAEGTDSIGARLTTALKEKFNTSSLFRLSVASEPRLLILISTAPEFPSRPSVGSVYCVIWAYSQKDDYLPMLLGREVGTISDEDIDGLVARLVERTDGLSVKYAYLWKR